MGIPIDSIKNVNDSKETWRLAVRVVDVWSVVNAKGNEHLEMVIMDSKGDRIQVMIRPDHTPKWKGTIKENMTCIITNGAVYNNDFQWKLCDHLKKFVFIGGTSVKAKEIQDLPPKQYYFKSFAEILKGNCKLDRLEDIIGYVHEIVHQSNSAGKKVVVDLNLKDLKGNVISCSLWESYGTKFLNYYNQNKNSGVIVIILTHAMIKDAQDQNNKRIVLALQSGLKSELTWALNTLTLLSFKEKDEMRKDATPLAKIPGLLDALLQVIDDWRDIALPKELVRISRVRSLGANSVATGFGNEYQALGSTGTLHRPSLGSGTSSTESTQQNGTAKPRFSELRFDEEGLFNLDDEGRAEKQQCAVAASNIIRNFSFMPDNEVIMAQNRHCMETAFQCIEDHIVEDEELVTNAIETIVNLAPLLDLRIFSSSKPSFIKITEKRAVQAIIGILNSPVKAWHCAAAELLGRLIINPDNEPFLLPFFPKIHKHLIDLISLPATDAQAAAIGALYNLAEVNMDCRLKIASERWAIDRLLKVIKTPHPVPEVCRKAAMILESLVSEPQNRTLLLAHENAFAEILFTDSKYSDTFARILYELSSRPSNKVATARGIWGM